MSNGTTFLDSGPLETKQSKMMPIWVKALIALFPALIFLLAFTIYPIINTALIGFIENFDFQTGMGSFALGSYLRQLDMYNRPDYWAQKLIEMGNENPFTRPLQPILSFRNFTAVLKDSVFRDALINTFTLTIISVPLTILISLMIAVSLNAIKPLRAAYQTIFFLPYVTNTIAIGLVFNTIFSYQTGGIMNQLLTMFGGRPVAWVNWGLVTDPITRPFSKFSLGVAIIVQTIWSGLAFKILVFMSGLASIDKQYYDAARIDGANRTTILRRVTVPLLSPQILYITITSFIGSFKAYSSIIAVVGLGTENFGGDNGQTWITVVGYIYKNRTKIDTLPKAAAGSVILLIIILLITLVQMQISKKRVHY